MPGTPIRRRSQSVSVAAVSGRRELLVALPDRIADEIDGGTPARDLASLSRRLLEIAEQIAALDKADDDISSAAATPDVVWRPSD